MSQQQSPFGQQRSPYAPPGSMSVSQAVSAAERGEFIQKTYSHLLVAIAAFIAVEWTLLQIPGIEKVIRSMVGMGWLVVLGGFMFVSWIADKWARSAKSLPMQYAGLGLYVVAQAVVFLPLIYIAVNYAGASVLPMATGLTLVAFTALTATVFIWKADFSFLRSFLVVGGFLAMGMIVVSILFGFNLGVLFSGAMVVFASASVLYSTSNIVRHYQTTQYVAASLGLFASVALLFWYVLQILISLSGRD